MSYTAAPRRTDPAAALAAIAVPAGFGIVLIAGLAVTGVIKPPVANPTATTYTDPEILPPPDPVPPSDNSPSAQSAPSTPAPTRPQTDFDFGFNAGTDAVISDLPGLDGDIGPVDLPDFGTVPLPTPSPAFDPVAASPSGNPGGWITNNDYRTSWIRRGFEGEAGFALSITANGRVNGCTITRSTGHAALDTATCELLTSRARFNPARDSMGNAVAGTYRSTVTWRIPE